MNYCNVNEAYKENYFDAQNNLVNGTKISDLKHLDNLSSESSSADQLSFDLPSIKSLKKDHTYYIKVFSQNMTSDDASLLDIPSDVYDHVKKCKYCRMEVKSRIKKHYTLNKNNNNKGSTKRNRSYKKLHKKNGHNIKEFAIVFIIGLTILLILDLFMKLGKSAK